MEHLAPLITDLAIIMVTAGIVTLIFRKIRMPVVLGYIVAGFLISPQVPWIPTVTQNASITIWADIGIIFLMFALGLEFSFKKIADMGAGPAVAALTVVSCMTLTGFAVGSLLGWGRMNSIFLGGMISMSSTMIILKAFEDYGIKRRRSSQIVLGALVIEDICGIFMMIILSTIAAGSGISGIDLTMQIGKMILVLVVWIVLAVLLIPTFLDKVRDLMNDETCIVVSLGICFLMVVISDAAGFSSALGAFLAGSVLAGTVSAGRIAELTEPVKNMFGAVFFVSVGMMVEPSMLIKYLPQILIITAVTIFGQMIFSTAGMLLGGENLETAVNGGSAMVQIGEFSFILATLGRSLGVIGDFLFPVIVCVSVITIFTTPLFIKSSGRILRIAEKILPAKLRAYIEKNAAQGEEAEAPDSDWKRFMTLYFIRTLVAAAALYFIYYAGVYIIDDALRGYGVSHHAAMSCAAVIGLMVIPIVFLFSGRGRLYMKLWFKKEGNRVPLITMRVVQAAIALSFIAAAIRHFAGTSSLIVALPVLIVLILISRSDYMHGRSMKLEARFVANMNEGLLRRKKDAGPRNVAENLRTCEVTLGNCGGGLTVEELFESRVFDVIALQVTGGGRNISMPAADTMLYDGNRVRVLGSPDQVEAFTLKLKEDGYALSRGKPMTLNEYLKSESALGLEPDDQIFCAAIEVTDKCGFAGSSIRNSGFRAKYGGLIIAIEKNFLPIIDPQINTIIEKNDILWVIGTNDMASALLEDGLMDEG